MDAIEDAHLNDLQRDTQRLFVGLRFQTSVHLG